MRHQVIHDIQTKEYYLTCIFKEQEYHTECFLKTEKGISHLTIRYTHEPSIELVILSTKTFGIVSSPSHANESCMFGRAMYLYGQLCNHISRDPVTLLNKAYPLEHFSQEDFARMEAFGAWQGMERITKWNKVHISTVLNSLTTIHFYELRNVVVELLHKLHHL